MTEILDALPVMAMILNSHRQIVVANAVVQQALGLAAQELLQQRPGEALGCLWAKEGPSGCGTSEHCATCGAVRAILESQSQDRPVVEECRILVETPAGSGPLDLRVTATPKVIAEERFVIVALEDISQAKRLASSPEGFLSRRAQHGRVYFGIHRLSQQAPGRCFSSQRDPRTL